MVVGQRSWSYSPGMPVTERSAPTRRAILVAARQSFAANGYQATTIRGVAAAAGIDPSMVMRYYGSKAGLFRAATDVDLHLPELAGQPPQRLGEVLAWHFVTRWEGRLADEAITLLLRSALARDHAAEQMRTIFAEQVLGAIESVAGRSPETARRAGMIGSQLLGLALARYVLRLPPVAAMDAPTLVATVAPVLQHYLTGDLTGPVSGDHASAGPNSAKPRSRRPLPDSDDAPTAHE
jgi:AcrR family transcriptional regulator